MTQEEKEFLTLFLQKSIARKLASPKTNMQQMPVFRNCDINALADWVAENAEQFKVTTARWTKVFLRQPTLFHLSAQEIQEKITNTAKQLNISENAWLGTCLKQPQLLYCIIENLLEKSKKNAQLAGVSTQEWVQLCLKQPALFGVSTDMISRQISKITETFGLSKTDWLKSCFKNLALFFVDTTKLISNIQTQSAFFGILPQDWIRVCQKMPALYYLPPQTIHKKVKILWQMYKHDLFQLKDGGKKQKRVFKNMLFKNPIIMTLSMENLHQRCTYARYLKYQKQPLFCNPLWRSKGFIEAAIYNAPEAFMARESKTIWPMNMRGYTQEREG